MTEFPPPPNDGAAPRQGITAGPDGDIWYADSSDRIGQMTPLGDYTAEFTGIAPPASSFAEPYYITSGPDGNLWFTEIGANRIGRLNISDRLFANGFEETTPQHALRLVAYLHERQVLPKRRYDDQARLTSQALEFIKDIKSETGSRAFYRLENEKGRLAAANLNSSSN